MEKVKKDAIKNKTLSSVDGIQKTWIPEGTKEYTLFKLITQENAKLIEIIKKHLRLGPKDFVLDVGGRDGSVAFEIQDPRYVHIVDPDPTIKLLKKPGKFWNEKVQNVAFDPKKKYKLIICSHVLGYLGLQEVQRDVVKKLTSMLDTDGALVMFYNSNIGYMRELIDYSLHVLPTGHYDYFDENILRRYRELGWEIKRMDVSFSLRYRSFEELARSCWFLFGSIDPNIKEKAKRFIPKLKNDLIEPAFTIDEKILFIFKREQKLLLPTIR